MEIKVNKEFRAYSESVFFGLSLRQFLCALLAVGVAIGLYFLLRDLIGTAEIGWVCILGALPFGMFGFFRYHGLPLERFLLYWVQSEFLLPNRLAYAAENRAVHVGKELLAAPSAHNRPNPRNHANPRTPASNHAPTPNNPKGGRRPYVSHNPNHLRKP